MSRMWRILAGAFLTAAVGVLVNVVAAPLVAPKGFYAIALAGLVLLIIATALMDHSANRTSGFTRAIRPRTRSTRPPQVLEGKRQRRESLGWALPFFISMFAPLYCIPAGVGYIALGPSAQRNPAAGATLLVIGFSCVTFAVAMILGVRVRLQFSDDGILLRDIRGRSFIGWDDAANFRTMKPFLISVFLVADPVSDSSWYLGPWKFDDDNNVIRICDLTAVGIQGKSVEFALKHWDPNR